ncbi:Conserved_hypothetical protein [Hexamita inflata]|uniref:Uncharacterized protein n=1 Tax=Hexamita inflata TaxID=28002 RepID=A0AA86RR10_9EUKA|nr:Conserved hypothetical protein [Hexamita inflata]
MNSEKFTQALFEYLKSKNIHITNEPRIIQYELLQMTQTQRRGIWEFTGNILGANAAQTHNYYHNTWCMQFYDDVAPYRHHITSIVKQNPFRDSSDLVQQFLDRFTEKNFSRHTVQQIVNIQKSRLSKKIVTSQSIKQSTSSEGFSIDIDSCLRFSDAVK